MSKPLELAGQRYNKLLVLESVPEIKNGCRMWLCQCDCGKRKIIRSNSIRSGNIKSCGCLIAEKVREAKQLRPYESLFNWLLKQVSRRPVPCELTYEDFVRFTKQTQCHYCGGEVYWTRFNINANSSAYNLDRKDNTKGYTVDNCVVCCPICNSMKSSLNYEEFLERIHRISKYERNK